MAQHETVFTVEDLRDVLEARGSFLELWVERDDEQTMAVLLNDDRGWITHFRFDGDSGLHSENPAWQGEDIELEFLLGNGQMDHYPARWTFDIGVIQQTLEQFIRTGEAGGLIAWRED
jgi:hypothetical protein